MEKSKVGNMLPALWANEIVELLNKQLVMNPLFEIVRRPWKERLFTKPWKPLQKTKIIIKVVPKHATDKVRIILKEE